MTKELEGGEGTASRPDRSLPRGKTGYPLYRGLGGHEGRSGQVWKISPSPGFDLRTVQPVAIRYTDYAKELWCYLQIIDRCEMRQFVKVLKQVLPKFLQQKRKVR